VGLRSWFYNRHTVLSLAARRVLVWKREGNGHLKDTGVDGK